jgi:putative protease
MEKKLKEIGKIIHYFDHIKVAVVSLSGALEVGDKIRIIGGEETDFSQEVESMEVDHEKIKKAKKGDEVGMTVKEKVRDGYKVYLE